MHLFACKINIWVRVPLDVYRYAPVCICLLASSMSGWVHFWSVSGWGVLRSAYRWACYLSLWSMHVGRVPIGMFVICMVDVWVGVLQGVYL